MLFIFVVYSVSRRRSSCCQVDGLQVSYISFKVSLLNGMMSFNYYWLFQGVHGSVWVKTETLVFENLLVLPFELEIVGREKIFGPK